MKTFEESVVTKQHTHTQKKIKLKKKKGNDKRRKENGATTEDQLYSDLLELN